MEVVRQRRAKFHVLAGDRMVELKPCRVQEVPLWRKHRQAPPTAAAVRVVTNNRVADRSEVHPDLVRSPGEKVRPQEISTGEASKSEKIRACMLSCGDDCHSLSVSRIACNGFIHR